MGGMVNNIDGNKKGQTMSSISNKKGDQMTTLDKMLQGLANALGASLSTLTTTAKTVVGAINELKSGLTSTNTTVSGHTSTIGSGTLDTTAKTIIPAINEINGKLGSWGTPVRDTSTSNYTATSSGVMVVVATTKNANSLRLYATDNTAGYMVAAAFAYADSGSNKMSITFPVIKGHVYAFTVKDVTIESRIFYPLG